MKGRLLGRGRKLLSNFASVFLPSDVARAKKIETLIHTVDSINSSPPSPMFVLRARRVQKRIPGAGKGEREEYISGLLASKPEKPMKLQVIQSVLLRRAGSWIRVSFRCLYGGKD